VGQHVDQIAPEDGSVDVEEALLRLDVVLDLFDFLGVDVGVGVADDLDNLRLKTLRTEAGWSQAELAEKIDSDARQVSRYENNKVAPGLEAVIRMAQVFNVTVDYLLVDDAERRPSRSQQPRRRPARRPRPAHRRRTHHHQQRHRRPRDEGQAPTGGAG